VSIFLLALAATATWGATITVDDDGPADFDNIQAAINDANGGDIVEVKPGAYTGPGNRDIDFLGKAITVRSTDPNNPDVVAATIVDCNGTELEPHRGFKFVSGEDTNSVLRGLTIACGFGPEETGYDVPPWIPFSVGGGIFCDNSSPTISDCIITGNAAGTGLTALDVRGAGGGLACRAASPTIVRCQFSNNFACYGGAIFGGHEDIDANKAAPEIINCSVTNNSSYCGAGICGCDGNIIDCTISDNNSYYGGGLYGCDGHIDDCNISDNYAEHRGGGLYECGGLISNSNIVRNFVAADPSFGGGGGICCIEAVPTITDCNISYNSAGAGGGICNCAGPISRSIITGNTSSHHGGGLASCDGPITECTVTANKATDYGGGFFRCQGDISNCTISFNTAQREGGGLARCNGSIDNCIITGNAVLEIGNEHPFLGSWGGGLLLCYGDITNCTITHNSAGGSGGGLAACPGPVTNCAIAANTALYDGGGLWECRQINNCIITGNRAPRGGAVFSAYWGDPNITGSTIVGNCAEQGGGILCYYRTEATINNCILWSNEATEGPQLALKATFIPPSPFPVGAPTVFLSYSDIEGGADAIHMDPYSTLIWESGNIDADPCFLLPGYWEPNGTPGDANDDYWVGGDNHLTAASPCSFMLMRMRTVQMTGRAGRMRSTTFRMGLQPPNMGMKFEWRRELTSQTRTHLTQMGLVTETLHSNL
jgi:hypothetical protein